MSEDTNSPLFRPEAVRHNTPGLFGEVRLHGPPASWLITLVCTVALALIAALLFGLTIEGTPLWHWLFG